ncbi:hypothetical protein [Pseudoalteromonas xiamenensis]
MKSIINKTIIIFALLSSNAFAAPGTPSISTPSKSDSGYFTVSWGSGSGEKPTRYELIGEGISGGIYTGSATSSSRGPLGNGTYYYRVRACNSNGCSGYSSVVSTTVKRIVLPGVPSISSPSYTTTGIFTVSWSASSGPVSYFQLIGEGKTGFLEDGFTMSSNRNVRQNGTYYYRVRACNSDGCSDYSPTTSITVNIPQIPQAPTITAPQSSTSGNYQVSWSPNGNVPVACYTLVGESSSSPLYTGSKTFLERTNIPEGIHYYRVKACGTASCEDSYCSLSDVVSTNVTRPVAIPTSVVAQQNERDIQVSWSKVAGAIKYLIQVKFNENDEKLVATINDGNKTSYVFNNLSDGARYFQIAACISDTKCSLYSSASNRIVIQTPTIETPSAPNARLNNLDIDLTWPRVAWASYYVASVKFNNNDFTVFKNSNHIQQVPVGTPTVSLFIPNLTDGKRVFKVRACDYLDRCSSDSLDSNETLIGVGLQPPQPISATVSDGNELLLSWNLLPNAHNYTVGELKDGVWTILATDVLNSSYALTYNNTERLLGVQSCTSWCSEWSNIVKVPAVNIVVPDQLLPANIGKITWNIPKATCQSEQLGRTFTQKGEMDIKYFESGLKNLEFKCHFEGTTLTLTRKINVTKLSAPTLSKS